MSLAGLRPERCLITGASGYIGSRLCERLPKEQAWVALLRNPRTVQAWQQQGRAVVQGDLLEAARVREALRGCDAVIHLAQGDRAEQATRQLVQAAAAAGVRRFVHISTMSVHGPVPGPEAASEDTATVGRYNHDYSDSKAAQEQMVQAAHDRGDLPVVILRPTIVYGLGGHFERQVIDQARAGVVSLFDEGRGACNAVFVDDVCDAIDAALVCPQAVGQALFINGDEALSWGRFIQTFAAMVQPPPRLEHLDAAAALAYWAAHPPVSATGLAARVRLKLKRLAGWRPPVAPWPPQGRIWRETFPIHFRNDKAKRLLGWSPQVDFDRGAALTRDWLQARGLLEGVTA